MARKNPILTICLLSTLPVVARIEEGTHAEGYDAAEGSSN